MKSGVSKSFTPRLTFIPPETPLFGLIALSGLDRPASWFEIKLARI
jgi:hypothetical protein